VSSPAQRPGFEEIVFLVCDLEYFDFPNCEMRRTREKSVPGQVRVVRVRWENATVIVVVCVAVIGNPNVMKNSTA
jgi:hypothetical protein